MSDEWPEALERGVAGAPLEGHDRSGDLAVFVPTERGGLACVIDGLGHGDPAADASETAAEVVRAHADSPVHALLDAAHRALQQTRGVVMTLASFDLERSELSWTGVGNVEARLVRAGDGPGARFDSPLVFAGVLGYNLPRVKPHTVPFAPGDAVVFVTDGIEPDFSGVLTGDVPAQDLADRVYARHGRGTDDALAVVVRYAPRAAG
jgi:negative regulator of sigma-B (phosphoserine phosphatase)